MWIILSSNHFRVVVPSDLLERVIYCVVLESTEDRTDGDQRRKRLFFLFCNPSTKHR